MHLVTRVGIDAAMRIAADMASTLYHQHARAEFAGGAFRDRQPEESGTDNDEIGVMIIHRGIVAGSHPRERAPIAELLRGDHARVTSIDDDILTRSRYPPDRARKSLIAG